MSTQERLDSRYIVPDKTDIFKILVRKGIKYMYFKEQWTALNPDTDDLK